LLRVANLSANIFSHGDEIPALKSHFLLGASLFQSRVIKSPPLFQQYPIALAIDRALGKKTNGLS
jgi:hypothetical protein